MNKKYGGVVVPMVTPLNGDYSLDVVAVERLLLLFRQHGVQPFVLGTTGEASSMPAGLKQEFVRVAGRVKKAGDVLYVGIGSNCLADSVEAAKFAFGAGADVVVATLPSYYMLTEAQMEGYFERLASQAGGPLIIYNIPATTHHTIPVSVIDRLSHHHNIVGAKDSERSEERLSASLKLWSGRRDFSHFLGWTAKSGEALLGGGDGLVPSTANFAPALYRDMLEAAAQGDREKVGALQALSDELGNSYQAGRLLGESLAALKRIMEKEGLCGATMMPPL
ncbi:dihydrodipicolinate synthase family protein [Puia sp. P3]|uniref:dihydrodipicolinate synthase family protein n=1 Tax=Puia sp. P3 TaxID=3423952 RepID=UPI003D670B2E